MAEDRATIDPTTILDDSDARRVDFTAEASGERYAFTILYDVLEALGATIPEEDAPAIVRRHLARIEGLAAVALVRDPDQERIVISENDLI